MSEPVETESGIFKGFLRKIGLSHKSSEQNQSIPLPDQSQTLPAQESAEIPRQFMVVIADDERYYADNAKQATEAAFTESGRENGVATIAPGAKQLLELSMRGNNGQQVNVVLLDDSYYKGGDAWRFRYADFFAVAKSVGKKTGEFEKSVDVPGTKDVKMKPANWLFRDTNSTTLALALRFLGFEGKIFTVSSAPPHPKEIRKSLDEARSMVPSFPDRFPVDGSILKSARYETRAGEPETYFSISPDELGEFWASKPAQTFNEGIKNLLQTV